MSQDIQVQYTALLKERMQQVGIASFNELSRLSGVSQRQILRLRTGEVLKLRLETLLKLSKELNMSVDELLALFSSQSLPWQAESMMVLKQEYQRLQQQMEQQQETLMQQFQESSLAVLESWMTYWPTASAAAQKNPNLPAIRLIPLVKPVEMLLQQWGVDAIAVVGEILPYDPQYHQLIEGNTSAGDPVEIRNVGYRYKGKLLQRAKVSPTQG